MTPLAFIDTETTGVHPDRRVWEVAIIRRDDDGETERLIQVRDVDLSSADPFGLKVGGFYDRHAQYGPQAKTQDEADARGDLMTEQQAAFHVERLTRGAHLVAAVPSFDAGCLDPMLRRHGLIPAWHYHLIDVEAMAVGWLAAQQGAAREAGWGVAELGAAITPPWKSDELSRLCGTEPPADDERHTALGDARWAMRWYDVMTGATS